MTGKVNKTISDYVSIETSLPYTEGRSIKY
jgi:hypothetical protein